MFVLFYEVDLVPSICYLIAIWGGTPRRGFYAAMNFLISCSCLQVLILAACLNSLAQWFPLPLITVNHLGLPLTTQLITCFSNAADQVWHQIPLVPLHTAGLPDAYVGASPPVAFSWVAYWQN